MRLVYRGHDFGYEIEKLCSVFFPYEKMIQTDTEEECGEENFTQAVLLPAEGGGLAKVTVRIRGEIFRDERFVPGEGEALARDAELEMATLLYHIFGKVCGQTPKWGLLTGVRPIKLYRRLTEEFGEGAQEQFRNKLLVSEEKTALARETERAQTPILNSSRPESFSLYISIPFCPSRCSYCSFVSQTVERAKVLVPDYVARLKEEIAQTGEIARDLGLRLETVYFGGGTPTTLSAEQLQELIGTVRGSFDLSTVREFTVEAGRPDTITREKLLALRECGVDRISINPQTMNDEVLERIGRRHSAKQTEEAFWLARECGFGNINMDTIAGLPGESAESFRRTMQILTDWNPESITVHTLALKRSSNFNQNEDPRQLDGAAAEEMVEYSQKILPQKGYAPYYLYRQSRMLANLENVGWSKPGFENLYNVFIMEETHTILACGAGAVTKYRQPGGERIERIFNFKYPYEYNTRFAEILQRKKGVKEFYESDQ